MEKLNWIERKVPKKRGLLALTDFNELSILKANLNFKDHGLEVITPAMTREPMI